MDQLGHLDKFEQLAADGEYVVVLLGNHALTDFALIRVSPIPEDEGETLSTRGLCFLGCIGLVDGHFKIALDYDLPHDAIDAITRAFCEHIAARLTPKLGGDDWLKNLWRLRDPRPN